MLNYNYIDKIDLEDDIDGQTLKEYIDDQTDYTRGNDQKSIIEINFLDWIHPLVIFCVQDGWRNEEIRTKTNDPVDSKTYLYPKSLKKEIEDQVRTLLMVA